LGHQVEQARRCIDDAIGRHRPGLVDNPIN